MKKAILALMSVIALGANGQTKGKVEVYDLDGFKLHVYYTNDALGDASYIIEGKESVVTMEQPLFKDNITEFNAYLDGLNKPVSQRISDYHVGGTGEHDVVMAEGMPAFSKGEIYGGMMQNFAHIFGDAITELPTGKATKVAFGNTENYAGVSFEFRHGASSDFPAASILIGKQVYYTHWAPAKAHISPLQVSSRAAINAEIAEAERSLKSGAQLFIGGHGGAADKAALEFKIGYLKTLKSLLKKSKNADELVAAMQKAYPNWPGEDNLQGLAKAMFAN